MSGELQRAASHDVAMRNMLAPYEHAIGELIPRTGVTPAAFMVAANQAVARMDDFSRKICLENPEKLMSALMKCAILGHVPGTKQAAIVAYGGKNASVEVIEQYHGLIERAQRAAPGLVVASGVVRESDDFYPEEKLGEPCKHVIRPSVFATIEERGKRIGVYAQARLPQGNFTQSVALGIEQLEKIASMSRKEKFGEYAGRNRFWTLWWDEMAMKAAIKRIRGLPQSSEWRQETDRLVVAAQRIGAQTGVPAPDLSVDGEFEPDDSGATDGE